MMLRTFACALVFALSVPSAVWAQAGPKSEVFRREAPALQRSADQAIGEVPGISLLQAAKAAYLDEFGVVVTLEIALEPPRNPFSSASSDRTQLPVKQNLVRDKMKDFLTKRAAGIQSADGAQFITIVVHLFNANPVDSPNLPRQMVFTVKKQDPSNVTIREY